MSQDVPLLTAEMLTRAQLAHCAHWPHAFAGRRKDRRYYEIVEDTIRQGFDYRYIALRTPDGEVVAVQPCFMLDQDLLAGTGPRTQGVMRAVRRVWPRCLKMRTLMVGCAAGEGHLDAATDAMRGAIARALAAQLPALARRHGARLLVFKEFPAEYRTALAPLLAAGFARMPSMPNTRLPLPFADFEAYLRTLSSTTRQTLRRKFRATAAAAHVEMTVVTDLRPYVGTFYPYYLAVYEKAELKFEKLTPEYFAELSARMPDRVRGFVWHVEGRLVAAGLCLVDETSIASEYVAFDYRVAHDLNLYYVVVRDIIAWGIAQGLPWFRSTGLNYEPKYRMRQQLDPIDLYVRHTSPFVNLILGRVLPLMEPTRHDPVLQRFANFGDLR